MGDGEHDATLGPRSAPGAGSNGQRIAPPRALAAAPWERFSAAEPDNGAHLWQAEPPVEGGMAPPSERATDTDRIASHANGAISVADLIAKIGAPLPDRPSRRHGAPDTESEDDVAAHLDDVLDTQVIETPAYSLDLIPELSDFDTANYPNDDELEADGASAAAAAVELGKASTSASGDPKAAVDNPESRRPMLLAGRSLAALFAVLALVMTGSAWHWSNSKNDRLKAVSALDPHSADIIDPNGQYGDENFLLVGMDSRAGENANMGAGDADDAGGARSDTVMLVNIPANRQRVVVVSFPRDLAITPMQCEAWNPENGKYGPIYDPKTGKTGPRMVYTETKLNSTFSFGGPKCLVKEIQKLSGLNINRFIAVDFVGFARMVEALGGVEVCSTTPLKDYELGTVLDHAGRQVINGATALNYVRARQVTTESNGDYGRIKRQQLFVSSLLRTLISSNTLLNLNKLNNVVNVFISNSYVDNVRTRDLVQLGQSLQHIAAGHVTFVTVPTGVTDQNGDEPPRTADMKALFAAIINDDPLPLENDHNAQSLGRAPTTAPSTKTAPPPSAAPESRREQVMTTSPHEVTVQVSNSTAQTGLAAIASSQLRRNGFNVMAPDDYPSSLRATTVFFSPGNEQAAATVASAFATSKVERVTGIGPVVQVVLGPDFSSVTAPPPSGSSITMQIERNSSGPPTKLPGDLAVTNAADTTCE
jgi:LCP family protein required for cell wall assembly